jgi:membrane-associated protease RseP (regulator of RpoE activity)
MQEKTNWKTYLLQSTLFVLTILSTMLAGAQLIGLPCDDFWSCLFLGLPYSIAFLGILTVHEFGHYLTAKYYKIKVTLPYYIPLPFIGIIGTLGAFIRIKERIKSRKETFDVGIAGPLAGFVVALLVLWYGFTHLPAHEDFLYKIHPEYQTMADQGLDYREHAYTSESDVSADSMAIKMAVGKNLLFLFFEKYVVIDASLIPHQYELMHYPFIFAGMMALFFTALNLIPIGQLDGGHVLYGLLGYRKQKLVSSIIFILFVYLAGAGMFAHPLFGGVPPIESFNVMLIFAPLHLFFLYFLFQNITDKLLTNVLLATVIFVLQYFTAYLFPSFEGFPGYLVFAIFISRFSGIAHPPAEDDRPLDGKRKILGWVALIIFILCFTPDPIRIG